MIYDEIIRLLVVGDSVMDIHRRTGVARNTIYDIKRELKSLKNSNCKKAMEGSLLSVNSFQKPFDFEFNVTVDSAGANKILTGKR